RVRVRVPAAAAARTSATTSAVLVGVAIRVGVMRQVSAQLCQRVRVTASSAGGLARGPGGAGLASRRGFAVCGLGGGLSRGSRRREGGGGARVTRSAGLMGP